MKVLQLTSHTNVGGISQYALSLSKRLARRGHRVAMASGGGQLVPQVEAAGLAHWKLPLRTRAEFSPQVFWSIRQLARRLKAEPVDLIHAHTRVAQVVAERIRRELKIPYVTTWHGIYKARLGRRLWPCTGARTIAISGPVLEHLRKDFHVPEKRIRLVYNGIDTAHYAQPPGPEAVEEFRRRCGIRAGQPVVGAIGRLAAGRVKGFDTLLVAVHLLRERLPNLQILIVGDGPRGPFLEDVASRLRIRDRVRFIGEARDIRMPLALMDVFVFPSRWPEAFGLTLVEAMAAGKPVIATRVGAVPEIVRHGIEGWLIPPDEPGEMSDGIVRLLSDPAAASALGVRARARVYQAFSLDRMAEEVEAVYEEVIR